MILAVIPSLATAHEAPTCESFAMASPGVAMSFHECGWPDHDDEDDDDAPEASIASEHARDRLRVAYGLQFLPDLPGHHVAARLVGDHAYFGGELRYLPASNVVGVGRLGAGLDLLGRSRWDLTLGVFLGTAGEWDRQIDRAVLYAAPIAGTEIGLGYEGDELFAGYRWLAGLGGGPVDDLLTENEVTVGYKVTSTVHAFGQYLLLSPGEHEDEAGVGLGVRVVL